MSGPFTPVGGVARWRQIYTHLLTVELGEVVTYQLLGQMLEMHPDRDRHAIQMAFRRAAKEYEENNNRAVEAVPNLGYRVVMPGEHLRLAQGYQRRSGKALVRGRSKVVHVDFNGMDPAVRSAFETTAQAFAVLIDYGRRLDVRQDNLEQALSEVVGQQERTTSEVAELKERLSRLEAEMTRDRERT